MDAVKCLSLAFGEALHEARPFGADTSIAGTRDDRADLGGGKEYRYAEPCIRYNAAEKRAGAVNLQGQREEEGCKGSGARQDAAEDAYTETESYSLGAVVYPEELRVERLE